MKIKAFGKRVVNILKWKKITSVKSWFEENIELTKGKTRGMFDTSEVPHIEKIFEIVDKKEIRVITLRVASQTQKTTFSIGMLMYWVDTDYHDLFYMIPRASDLKKFLNFKIKPFLNNCKVVKEKLEEYAQDEKERKNSFFYKTATNLLAIISSNDTKSITTKYGVFDEASEMDVATIEEALERFKDYGSDYKVIIVSTQIDEDDAINHYYDMSEATYMYFLKCIHCNEFFVPKPKDLRIIGIEKYKTEHNIVSLTDEEILRDYIPYASRLAYLECPKCSSMITNKDKNEAITSNQCEWFYVAKRKTDDGYEYSVIKDKEYYESVGFDLNSMLSKRVSISQFAEKELKCKFEKNPAIKEDMYKKFYAGWWNLIYKSEAKNDVNKNEVLKICNGYNIKEVPKNVSSLHMGVDLQKDRLYYRVDAIEYARNDNNSGIVAHIIDYGELWAGLDNQDFRDLTKIIEAVYYDQDGVEYKITSVGCDIRGFSLKEEDSRSNAMLDFIFNYAYELKENGVVDYDNFIHPFSGVDKLYNAQFEAQGYKMQEYKKTVEGEEIRIKGITFSNMAIKKMQHNMIRRTIEKVDKNLKYKTGLLYATNEMCIRNAKRQQLPPQERREKHSLEAHLSSEHLSYVKKNGKFTKNMAFVKKFEGARNDWWDCGNIIIAQILAHETHKLTQYEDNEENLDINNILSNYMK